MRMAGIIWESMVQKKGMREIVIRRVDRSLMPIHHEHFLWKKIGKKTSRFWVWQVPNNIVRNEIDVSFSHLDSSLHMLHNVGKHFEPQSPHFIHWTILIQLHLSLMAFGASVQFFIANVLQPPHTHPVLFHCSPEIPSLMHYYDVELPWCSQSLVELAERQLWQVL